jgi:hypothetical protein
VDNDTGDLSQSATLDADATINKVLGRFDVPAFARRGHDLEQTLERLDHRCRAKRLQMLDMVRMRLKQWARVASGPDDARLIFAQPIDPLWELCSADPPQWSRYAASPRRRRAVGSDLIGAIGRFNERWAEYVATLNLDPTNFVIEQYNRYYVLEKECMLGSTRLAARHFTPAARVTSDQILSRYPGLPVPELFAATRHQQRG